MDNFIDRIYKEDTREQLDKLEAVPVFIGKSDATAEPFKFIALGIDFAHRPDTAYVNGIFYSEDN